MIEVARETLTRAGLADRATFIRGHSHRVELPQRVDLVICDHVGYFGFDYGIVHTLQDARRRFLKPGGRVIPARIRLQLAAVESRAAATRPMAGARRACPTNSTGCATTPSTPSTPSSCRATRCSARPPSWARSTFGSDSPDFFRWTATLRIERDGTMHGLAGWFDCELADGVSDDQLAAVGPRDRPLAGVPADRGSRSRSARETRSAPR